MFEVIDYELVQFVLLREGLNEIFVFKNIYFVIIVISSKGFEN